MPWVTFIFLKNVLAISFIIFWPDGCHGVLIAQSTFGLTCFWSVLAIVLKYELDPIAPLLVVYIILPAI